MQFVATLELLNRIGWRAQDDLAAIVLAPDMHLARVSAVHRNGLDAENGEAVLSVQVPMKFRNPRTPLEQKPTVGDWVLLRRDSRGADQLRQILPRRSQLLRAAAGDAHKPQLIAANVDVVIVVCGLDHDYNPRRLERYLVLIQSCGAQPVVALTKLDLSQIDDPRIEQTRQLGGLSTPVVALNAKDIEQVNRELLPYLGAGQTAVLVGSSGAGKSTLTNSLIGRERQKTLAVREHDSRGRHTTTARYLFSLESGACLIDTPGMREIKLWGEETVDASQFDDIATLAMQCRFRDCAHEREPGCAVRLAVDAGVLELDRLNNFLKLCGESAAAKTQLQIQQRKSEIKVLHRALNKRLTEKYGRH